MYLTLADQMSLRLTASLMAFSSFSAASSHLQHIERQPCRCRSIAWELGEDESREVESSSITSHLLVDVVALVVEAVL
jgi:hypothetical protein